MTTNAKHLVVPAFVTRPANFIENQLQQQQQQILSFASEGGSKASNTVLHARDLTNPILDCARDGRVHSITSFLERPVNYRTASWSTAATHPQGARLHSFKYPSDIIKHDMYARKLERFLGLRADLEVRVQVNAQPFHAGRLMLSWTPFADALGPERNRSYTDAGWTFLTSVTGNPRVEIDLSTTTEATMDIPFVSSFLYYNIVTGKRDIGLFQLIVYSPLVDLVSSGQINYTVWTRLKNVRAEFPTGMPMSIAQVGTEGQQQTKQGFVTRQSGAYSTILEPFTAIPLVGQAASWIKSGVDALHSVASVNGWSKPLNPSELQLYKNGPARFMCNADGSDMATNLGLTAQNELEPLQELFRTDVDEMNLSYISRTPNFVGRFDWTKNRAPGDILYSRPISPLSWYNTIGDTGVHVPHMAFCASHFVLWRGGINLTLKFVKTKFHSGRVRIIFIPGLYALPLPSNFLVDANYSTVVDLRSDTDVKFNIPYVSVVPWLHNKRSFWNGNHDETESTGLVVVEVLNELVNTSTVSDTIQVLVEVSAAEDLEFAIPIRSSLTLRTYADASVNQSIFRKIRSVAQVGVEEGDTPLEVAREETTTFAEVSNQPTTTTFNVAMLTMGEKVVSFRQILKRFHFLRPLTVNEYWVLNSFYVDPAKFSGGTQEGESVDADAISTIASIFAFYRGSMRFKIVPLVTPAPPLLIQLRPDNYYQGTAIVTPGSDHSRGEPWGAEVMHPTIEGVYELQIPFYSAYPVNLTTVNATSSDVLDARAGFNRTFGKFLNATDVPCMVYRSVGDDFSFGFLLGVPAMNHKS